MNMSSIASTFILFDFLLKPYEWIMLVCLTFLIFCFPFSLSLLLFLCNSFSPYLSPYSHILYLYLPSRFNSKNIIVGFGINSTIISICICILDQLPKSNSLHCFTSSNFHRTAFALNKKNRLITRRYIFSSHILSSSSYSL